VQGAGNSLEEKVRLLNESTILCRLEQEDLEKKCTKTMNDMKGEIQRLQADVVDQDIVNKD
jgi:hypothetical protein